MRADWVVSGTGTAGSGQISFALDVEVMALLSETDGQILTTLPGVASIRAAAFAAHSLPIERFPLLNISTPQQVWRSRSTSQQR